MKEGLTFDDVLIVPKYSEIRHRSEVNLSTKIFPDLSLDLPFISANMDTITESRMAFTMAKHGASGFLHRYMNIEEMIAEIEKYKSMFQEENLKYQPLVISLGVQDDGRMEAAYDAGIRHFCIDVAHGHHSLVKEKIIKIKSKFKNEVQVVAGNVATYEATKALYEWGADCVKVGIGPGSVCTTRIKTGAGYPQLSAIIEGFRAKKEMKKEVFLIADGGIKFYGDVTKALAAGADAVMMGSIFAGCKETPGIVWRNENEEMTKSFRGMASAAAQSEFGIENINEEGIALTVKYKGSARHILPRMAKGLRSGLSYSGARSIKELQEKVEFVKITYSSYLEGKPHKASK